MHHEEGWDDIDGDLGIEDSDENKGEEADVVCDLRSSIEPRSFSAQLSKTATIDASLSPTKRSSLTNSTLASTGTFVSARTHQSIVNSGKLETTPYGTSYFSTSPFSQALSKEDPLKPKSRDLPRSPMSLGSSSDYMALLEQNRLLPSIETELNWSGRTPGTGQHVEFEPYEEIPLENEGLIFCSATAKIEKS